MQLRGIQATDTRIATTAIIADEVDIRVRGIFEVGERSHIGPNTIIRGNNIRFGADVYVSGGLVVGGGGNEEPTANFSAGNRCVLHDNFINVCERVTMGDDVGLSPGVAIITHGFWNNVLQGHPRKVAPVIIEDGVIVGFRSILLPGVVIGRESVIGAGSVVAKPIEARWIAGGNPCRPLKQIVPPSPSEQLAIAQRFVEEYLGLARERGFNQPVELAFPWVKVDTTLFNLLSGEWHGQESRSTDHFRDCARKWGFRFYTSRPFGSWREGA